MRIILPCKKCRFIPAQALIFQALMIQLLLALLLSMLSTSVLADTDKAIFWAIEKDGQPAGYLLGTIHSEDPRVLEYSEDFLARLRNNDTFAMEMIPDLPTLARLTEYMRYPPGKTLESVIGEQRFKALVTALSGYSVPSEFISAMKPWAAMMTLSMPPARTGFFMDFSLSLRASGNGLNVVGLETLEEQLSFLEDMPISMQLSLLDQAIAQSDQVREAHKQMVDAYLENNLVELQSLSDEEFQTIGIDERNYFIESGIVARNQRMLESLLLQLEDNSVFVAVGALHLPGDQGLLGLLRQNGFELKPLDMPFNNQ